MQNSARIEGLWWTPDNPSQRLFGSLDCEVGAESSLRLVVPNCLGQVAEFPPESTKIIYGEAAAGNRVTLLGAICVKAHRFGPESLASSTYSIHRILHGDHLPTSDSILANTLTYEINHLAGWMQYLDLFKGCFRSDNAETSYKKPPLVRFRVGSNIQAEIATAHSVGLETEKATISASTTLRLSCSEGFTVSQTAKFAQIFADLLHFATMRDVRPTRIQAFRDGYGVEINGKIVRHPLAIITPFLRPKEEPEVLSGAFTFTYPDIADRTQEVFDNWFRMRTMFEEALTCYFSVHRNSLPYPLALLSMAQALEAYHGVETGTIEHRKFPLEKRIRELVDRHATVLFGLVDCPESFAKKVSDTRNYFTHHNPESLERGGTSDPAEVNRLTDDLRSLFQVCVLSDLGISAGRFKGRLRSAKPRFVACP